MQRPVANGALLCVLALGILVSSAPLALAAGKDLSPAPAGSFSIVVIPDTQRYVGRGTKLTPDSTAEVTNDRLSAPPAP